MGAVSKSQLSRANTAQRAGGRAGGAFAAVNLQNEAAASHLFGACTNFDLPPGLSARVYCMASEPALCIDVGSHPRAIPAEPNRSATADSPADADADADADSHERSPWFWTAALGVAGIIILNVVVARVGPAIRVSKILTSLASGLSASWIAMRSRSANRFVPVD
jgi:hypothetical protein